MDTNMSACREDLKAQLETDLLCEGRPEDREKINEILELMVETLCSQQDSFRIAQCVSLPIWSKSALSR